jgi:hypothetical protein
MNRLLNDVNNVLNNLDKTSGNGNGSQKGTRRRRKRNRKNKGRKGQVVRSRSSNNPLTSQGVRGPIGQSLTSSQFTATSPMNLFDVRSGSTPGGIRVRGRELIGGITKRDNTENYQLCNILGPIPGAEMGLNPRWFPRLASYAPIYEMFKFHSTTLIFQSNRPTTTAGAWMACVDYDSKDNAPQDTNQVMRNISCAMANVYSDFSCVALASLSRLPKYMIQESTTSDLNQTIQGGIFVACEGFAGAVDSGIGYLIIEYDVEFFTPQ